MSDFKVLVTGGCGYIGSHTIVDLINHGLDVVSIDSFIRSTPKPLEGIKEISGKEIKNYAIYLCDIWYEWTNETGNEFENVGSECCPEYNYPSLLDLWSY